MVESTLKVERIDSMKNHFAFVLTALLFRKQRSQRKSVWKSGIEEE